MIAVIRAHDGRQIIRHSASSHAKCRQGGVKAVKNRQDRMRTMTQAPTLNDTSRTNQKINPP
jgi:hypothetical protein